MRILYCNGRQSHIGCRVLINYFPITGLPDLLKCLRAHTAQFVLAMKTGDLLDNGVPDGDRSDVQLAYLQQMVEETGPDVRMIHLKQRMRNSSSISDAAPVDMTNYPDKE